MRTLKSVFMIISAAIVLALALTARTAAAAPGLDVENVALFMKDPLLAQKTLEVTKYDDGAIRVVFRAHGKRYTLYSAPGRGDMLPFLSIWVRPNGTSGQGSIETFTDHGRDGTVDFGIGGPATTGDGKYFRVGGAASAGLPAMGERFRAYWQALYDRAIADALKRLKQK